MRRHSYGGGVRTSTTTRSPTPVPVSKHIESTLNYACLCHIVTHADMHVRVLLADGTHAIARPAFSSYKSTMGKLLSHAVPGKSITVPSDRFGVTPIGVVLESPIEIGTLSQWRVRSRDLARTILETSKVVVLEVYFPLLSVLMTHWVSISPSAIRACYLVSGSGVPRNSSHPPLGNSSRNLARVIETWFIDRFYPMVEVTKIHSRNMFSFIDNTTFMNTQVRPLLARKRMQLANTFGEDWIGHLHVVLTLLNGPAARQQALSASLREYHPDYLYMSDNKTLWHRYPDITKLWDDDVELLEFSAAQSTQLVQLGQAEISLKLLVLEMLQHRDALINTVAEGNELEVFWLRKTRKPVLSVLLVCPEGEEPRYFRGMNLEVSMPTGSLCAERNAIGNALSSDPGISRKDIKMVAVLSMSLDPDTCRLQVGKAANPILPCGACKEWLKKIAVCNPEFKVITFDDMSCTSIHIRSV